jgi:hypothetical protein
LQGLAGLAFIVVILIIASALFRGGWEVLSIAVLPIGVLAAAEWLRRVTPEDRLILYSDRMELLDLGSRRSEFKWSDVVAIHWPKQRDVKIPIRIEVAPNESETARSIRVSLQEISRDDRLALIRYLRTAASQAKHECWSKFCYMAAVPLAEACQAAEPETGDEKPPDGDRSLPSTFMRRYGKLCKRHPFLAGLAVPLCVPLFLSRRIWWTLSVYLAISALINIRLVWGFWASPFTEMILGVSAASFVMGCLSPSRAMITGTRQDEVSGSHLWLALGLVFVPLLANAAVKGWIPIQMGQYIVLVGYCVLHAPIVIHLWRRKARERRDGPRLEADALRRWEIYESTGHLPDAEPRDAVVGAMG